MLANKKRICYLAAMPVRSCRVTIQDLDGVSHTVEVTAATLYEAVAQGLSLIRGGDQIRGSLHPSKILSPATQRDVSAGKLPR
jgi:hypothetical protein